MDVIPNSTIYLLTGVPLDNRYNNTLYFASKVTQNAYFRTKIKYSFQQQSYQRVNRNTMRVKINAERIQDCNYLYFSNEDFTVSGTSIVPPDNTYYAFITSVNYINPTTSEITYEIDVMQTWFYKCTLRPSFVVREHSETDNIGDNTIDEGLEIGEYIEVERGELPDTTDALSVVFVCSFNNDETLSDITAGTVVADVYSCLQYHVFQLTPAGITEMNDFVARIVAANKWEGLLGVYMSSFGSLEPSAITIPVTKNYTTLGEYTNVKNKKLFTYPYNLLHVFTPYSDADFRYEFFDYPENPNTCVFAYTATIAPTPIAVIAPAYYQSNETGGRLEYRLTRADYPQCATVGDTYKIWYAQNAASLDVKMMGTTLGALGGVVNVLSNVASFNPIGAIESGVNTLIDTVMDVATIEAQKKDIKTKPPQVNGTQPSTLDWSIFPKNFSFSKLCIKPEYAAIIDDFFSMFGYATHRVKVPNINVRENWTFTQTKNCVAIPKSGSGLPASALTSICKIFDHGITFWSNPAAVGNYNLSNDPL